MKTRWTPTALRDLEAVFTYIAEDNPDAAHAMVETILSGIAALERYPEIGRRGRVTGTRELVIPPYIVAYRTGKSAVEVLAIIHGSRRWPDSL